MKPNRKGDDIGKAYDGSINENQGDKWDTHRIYQITHENKEDDVYIFTQLNLILYLDIEYIEEFFPIY